MDLYDVFFSAEVIGLVVIFSVIVTVVAFSACHIGKRVLRKAKS